MVFIDLSFQMVVLCFRAGHVGLLISTGELRDIWAKLMRNWGRVSLHKITSVTCGLVSIYTDH